MYVGHVFANCRMFMFINTLEEVSACEVNLSARVTLARGLKIVRVYKQKFTGRVTLLPGTTSQTGLASINLVNKHATDNKFSAKTYFRVNYEFISSNIIIFHF